MLKNIFNIYIVFVTFMNQTLDLNPKSDHEANKIVYEHYVLHARYYLLSYLRLTLSKFIAVRKKIKR